MATKSASKSLDDSRTHVDRITLSRAMVAGLVGGVVFGIPLQFVIGRMEAIGAMYTFGEPSLMVGWVAHLAHSALFGVIYGLVTEPDPLHSWMERNIGYAALVGIAWGLALYVVNIVFIWPFWLQTVGFPPAADWSIPFFAVRPLFGHLLWGVITGTVFYALVDY